MRVSLRLQCCSSASSPLTAWEGSGWGLPNVFCNCTGTQQQQAVGHAWQPDMQHAVAAASGRPVVAAAAFGPGMRDTAVQLPTSHPPAQDHCSASHCQMQGQSSWQLLNLSPCVCSWGCWMLANSRGSSRDTLRRPRWSLPCSAPSPTTPRWEACSCQSGITCLRLVSRHDWRPG